MGGVGVGVVWREVETTLIKHKRSKNGTSIEGNKKISREKKADLPIKETPELNRGQQATRQRQIDTNRHMDLAEMGAISLRKAAEGAVPTRDTADSEESECGSMGAREGEVGKLRVWGEDANRAVRSSGSAGQEQSRLESGDERIARGKPARPATSGVLRDIHPCPLF